MLFYKYLCIYNLILFVMISESTEVYTINFSYIDIFVSNLLIKQRIIEFGKSDLLFPWFIYASSVNSIIYWWVLLM